MKTGDAAFLQIHFSTSFCIPAKLATGGNFVPQWNRTHSTTAMYSAKNRQPLYSMNDAPKSALRALLQSNSHRNEKHAVAKAPPSERTHYSIKYFSGLGTVFL